MERQGRSWEEVDVQEWQMLSTLIDLGVLYKGRMEYALTHVQTTFKVRLDKSKVGRLESLELFKRLQERLKEWIAGVGESGPVFRELEKVIERYE